MVWNHSAVPGRLTGYFRETSHLVRMARPPHWGFIRRFFCSSNTSSLRLLISSCSADLPVLWLLVREEKGFSSSLGAAGGAVVLGLAPVSECARMGAAAELVDGEEELVAADGIVAVGAIVGGQVDWEVEAVVAAADVLAAAAAGGSAGDAAAGGAAAGGAAAGGAAAGGAAAGGAAVFLATTALYCCISITAASRRTCELGSVCPSSQWYIVSTSTVSTDHDFLHILCPDILSL